MGGLGGPTPYLAGTGVTEANINYEDCQLTPLHVSPLQGPLVRRPLLPGEARK